MQVEINQLETALTLLAGYLHTRTISVGKQNDDRRKAFGAREAFRARFNKIESRLDSMKEQLGGMDTDNADWAEWAKKVDLEMNLTIPYVFFFRE